MSPLFPAAGERQTFVPLIPTIEPGESNSIIVGGDVAGVHVRYKILGADGCRRKVHFIGVLPGAPPPG